MHLITTLLIVLYGFFNIIYGFILMTYPVFPFLLGLTIVVLGLSFHFIAIEFYSQKLFAKWLAIGAFVATSIIAILIDLDMNRELDSVNHLIRNLFSLLVIIMIVLGYKDQPAEIREEEE